MSMIYDPETGEYVREEDLRERRLKQYIDAKVTEIVEAKLKKILKELVEEHEIEVEINIETGKGIGRLKRKG
jgi:hypothetical protein